jgi:glucosylceramidase
MSKQASRRDFLKSSALVAGSLGAHAIPSTLAEPLPGGAASLTAHDINVPAPSNASVWFTSESERMASGSPIQWKLASDAAATDAVRVIPNHQFQEILGFGGCFSDAACYQISQLRPSRREEFLHDLFHPSGLGLSVNRTCIGAADTATKLYSYDEGDPDPDLRRFSIEHDREYILPILRRVAEINPAVFYFSSPWSPPGWMKWNKSMLGGSMSRQYLSSYANYFLKFIQAYAAEGVAIQAITTQNEIDTDQHGQMPACTWSQECETEFITDHIGPLFERLGISTKIWILDHNYVYWGRVISELDDPDFRRYVNAVAWHGYVGKPSMMSKVLAAHPDVMMYFTEGSTDYNDPHYQDDWTKWSSTYAEILTNGCRSIAAWNVATDEHGKPNIGPYPCGGIVIINAKTQEVIQSGQYWALAHLSKSIKRGARRVETQSEAANLSHVAVNNPGGGTVLVLTNLGAARTVQIYLGLYSATVQLKENSIATMVWS